MKKSLKKTFLGLTLSVLISGYSLNALAQENLYDYILDPMPGWFTEGFTRGHLDINYMTKKAGFTRRDALEIQNQWKDLLESNPVYMRLEKEGDTFNMVRRKDPYILEALEMTINNFKANKQYESGFRPEALGKQDFYVAFDMDETLLVQWYETGNKGAAYYSYLTDMPDTILRPDFYSPQYFSLIPGWEQAFKEIAAIPGNKGIILFTAKEDKSSMDVISKIMIDGKPLTSYVKGIFTRNYLIRESSPTKLSKDLRMIDESLEHVILIDDNPTRILDKQLGNLREFPKYNAEAYLEAKNETKNQVVLNYFEKLLPVVVDEIKEAAEYSRKNNSTFAEAYLPYSMAASAEIAMLVKQGYSWQQAADYMRKNLDVLEPRFFFFENK